MKTMAENYNPFAELEARDAEQKTFIEKMAEHLDKYQPKADAKRVSVDELATMTEELEALGR